MFTVKGVKLPSVAASWKHIVCFSVTASSTVSILLYDEKILWKSFSYALFKKILPRNVQFSSQLL